MDRTTAEKAIGCCLEIIRLICLEYKSDFDICSMYVTPRSTSAFITDDEQDYLLQSDWREDDEE